MKAYTFVKIIFLCLSIFPDVVNAQGKISRKELEREAISQSIAGQRFIFKAQQVNPMRGRTRNVSTDQYTLKISPDTVTAYLPYFGRAYVAPLDPAKGGIHFTSTKFEYAKTIAKRGGWNILIKPSDVRDVRQLSLSISVDGFASLHVISTHRDPISFNGIIREK